MKILHLLQSGHFSGAENVVCQIIGMMKDEPDIQMAYCSRDGQIREALKERKINFYPIRELTVSEIKRVIREYRPDIIHAHDMRASFVAARACGKITLISHIHVNNFDSRGVSAKSIAYLFSAAKAKHIFWVSNSACTGYCFHSLFKRKSSVLYNIISIDDLYSKMHKDNRDYNYDIVYLGRLTPQKNPHRFLRVFKMLIEKKPDIRIAVIGTGELEEEIHKLATEMKLASNVEFLGFQSNPYKMLHDAKLMIMTSKWEGTPMCVLEAMALGVPVVSTPTDGVRDVVEDGKTGYLSDDDSELVEKSLLIIDDSLLREKISTQCLHDARQINNASEYKKRIITEYLRS